MISIRLVVLIVWTAYWIYSIAAAITTRMHVKIIARGETVLDRLIQNALMIIALYLIYSPYVGYLSVHILPNCLLVQALGCTVVIMSLFFADWSRRVLACNWSSAVQSVEKQKLVQHGPYRYIRHPIYTGVIGAFFGTLLVQGTLASLIALVCIVVKYILKINKEEQFLFTLFGPQYRLYKSKTWGILPFVY
jgi:protein-S-isoprenylcysteine O-methyltransferase Ste14